MISSCRPLRYRHPLPCLFYLYPTRPMSVCIMHDSINILEFLSPQIQSVKSAHGRMFRQPLQLSFDLAPVRSSRSNFGFVRFASMIGFDYPTVWPARLPSSCYYTSSKPLVIITVAQAGVIVELIFDYPSHDPNGWGLECPTQRWPVTSCDHLEPGRVILGSCSING